MGTTTRQNKPVRHKRLLARVLVLALFASGCGGSSDGGTAEPVADAEPTVAIVVEPTVAADDDPAAAAPTRATPEPGSVDLLFAGGEPRVELGISAADRRTIAVSVAESSTGTVGDDAIDVQEAAEFVVDVTVTPNGEGSSATVVPSIVSLDATTPAPTNRQLGPLQWTLDRHGQLIDADGPDLRGIPVVAAATLFMTPELFAVVPSEPVGVGAQWQYVLTPATPDTIYTVDLTGVTDTSIDLSITFTQSDELGTVTSTIVGTYARASLLAVDVDTHVRTEFTSETTRSGEAVDIEGTYELARSYAMEAE